jgi:hypothetical protein
MRYRIGESPDTAATSFDQGIFTSMTVLSLAMGVGFVFAGLRSGHYWMTFWGGGLAISSIGYLAYVMFFL